MTCHLNTYDWTTKKLVVSPKLGELVCWWLNSSVTKVLMCVCEGDTASAAGNTRVYRPTGEHKAIDDFIMWQSSRVDTWQLQFPVLTSLPHTHSYKDTIAARQCYIVQKAAACTERGWTFNHQQAWKLLFCSVQKWWSVGIGVRL